MFAIKRIYEPPDDADGARVLIDRLWPRGVSKDKAALTVWLTEVAPSTELRKWFGHQPDNWAEFCARYDAELDGNPGVDRLLEMERAGPVTLLYAAANQTQNHAIVLERYLRNKREAS